MFVTFNKYNVFILYQTMEVVIVIIFRSVNVIGDNICIVTQKFMKMFLSFYDPICRRYSAKLSARFPFHFVVINISLSSRPVPARPLFLIVFHNGRKKHSRKKGVICDVALERRIVTQLNRFINPR